MNRVGQMLGIQLGNSMGAIFTCVLSVGVSFLGSWVLALATLFLLPICGVLMMVLAGYATKNEPEAGHFPATLYEMLNSPVRSYIRLFPMRHKNMWKKHSVFGGWRRLIVKGRGVLHFEKTNTW